MIFRTKRDKNNEMRKSRCPALWIFMSLLLCMLILLLIGILTYSIIGMFTKSVKNIDFLYDLLSNECVKTFNHNYEIISDCNNYNIHYCYWNDCHCNYYYYDHNSNNYRCYISCYNYRKYMWSTSM